ncbi:Protease inhibitor protein [Plasmopara halstedii]|uniref:Protease inhibitor protein n=1 Tax=Plasmopara halstedii TaxID=4781 RepID=A0A0N7L6J0_PLAHL|nr:Protease inhibitor protein [Plasmopara halstedii]CEG44411.1 Protease inhibitor protein [Plasmopara halstedii]|eukprot:XP_024580780.1 Protease inhibitor protein [Plasmopara halstedii]
MLAALTFLLTSHAFAAASDVMTIGMTGSWSPAEITSNATDLLTTALKGDRYDSSVGEKRVCYTEVTSLETQVVAGTNYRFHMDGCEVTNSEGVCSESTLTSCDPSGFVVQIFEQTWTSTLKVTCIKPEESSDFSSLAKGQDSLSKQKMSEEEKKAIEAWILANGLNKYGDAATRIYLGGTPLFDEKTGATKDRYDYILSKHPDRPWQTTGVKANLLAIDKTEETVDATNDETR